MYRIAAHETRFVLENPGTSFLGRLAVNLRGFFPRVGWHAVFLGGTGTALATVFQVARCNSVGEPAGVSGAWEMTGWLFGGIWVLIVLVRFLRVVAKSLFEGPLERSLPRALTLYADHLEVVPATGEPYSTKWSYVVGYRARGTKLVLVVGREPRLEVETSTRGVGAIGKRTILEWLALNDVPRA
jgi:hypothetical protein